MNEPDGTPGWREFADRLEITELLGRYAHTIDAMDWELLRTVFTDDVTADFSSVGQYVEMGSTITGFQNLTDWYDVALTPFFGVMHFMTNHLIELDGDVARTKSYMHVLNMSMGGVYHAECVRTPDGWRIRYFQLEERRWDDVVAKLEGHMDEVDAETGEG